MSDLFPPSPDLRPRGRPEARPGRAASDPPDLSWLLLEALHRHRAVHLRYGGAWRVVHPHALGPTRTGKRAVLAWQTAGAGRSGVAEGWRLFDLGRIEAAEMLGATFAPRPRAPGGARPWSPGVPEELAAV